MLYVTAFLAVLFLSLSFMPVKNTPIGTFNKVMRGINRVEGKESASAGHRLLSRFWYGLAYKLSNKAPRDSKGKVARQLVLAGKSSKWSVKMWQGQRCGLALVCGVLTLVLVGVLSIISIYGVCLVIFSIVMGYILPDVWLKYQIKHRALKISEALPNMLDLITISMEAGSGFDVALSRAVEKSGSTNVLASEFTRVLKEMRMGKSRRDSLHDLALRNPSEDLRSWVSSIVQADQFGVSVGVVMHNQAKQMRIKRRQSIEEYFQKTPTKMVFIILLFIFPSLFVVIMGPAILNILSTLSSYKG